MRIDCAVGFCYREKFNYPWSPHRDYTAEDLAPILARNRFDGALAGALSDDPAETDWLLELSSRHSWTLGVFGRSTAPADWDRWQRHARFLGVDLQGPLGAPDLSKRGLAARVSPGLALEILDAAPSLRVVVRVTAGLRYAKTEFETWAHTLEPLRNAAVLIQADGLLRFLKEPGWNAAVYRPWIQHLLHTFPIGKLAFGSGWPLSMPHATWKESLACFAQALGPQSLEHRSRLFGENAADYFRVSVATVGYTEESPE